MLTKALAAKRLVKGDAHSLVERQRVFGLLTANTDMQRHNLSFFHSGTVLEAPSPAYDMQPMHFAPTQNQVVDRPFDPPIPRPLEGKPWTWAVAGTASFWTRVSEDKRVSSGFRAIAKRARASVEMVREMVERLPD